jgi:spore coat protein JB
MTDTIRDEKYYKLLHEIQAADFVVVELTLYLDTHPTDMGAIQQFNQFAQKKQQLVSKYEELYGPMLQYGYSYSKYPWQWDNAPWPWQV